MKYTFALIFCLLTVQMNAQQAFTERIQQVVGSMGRIILHQDKTITDLVNGPKRSVISPNQKGLQDGTAQYPDSLAADSLSQGPTIRINGYRIQVYFGDNSRKGKTEARAAGLRFRNYFPNQPVYVSFASPHWLCRAGDFRTIEEASEILRQIREMGIFREAVLVKSKIKVRL